MPALTPASPATASGARCSQSGKAATLRAVVRTQFRANKFETNPELAKQLRERCVCRLLHCTWAQRR